MGDEHVGRGSDLRLRSLERAAAARPRPEVSGQYVVGRADDPAEARADVAADAAMRSLAATGWQPSATPARIRRAPAPAGEAPTIGYEGGALDEATEATLRGAIGGGRPISPEVGERIRRSLGHDLSGARVHTDGTADAIASRIQASAFTVGRDMFFAKGEYQPDSADGMRTILHEASHVVDNGTRVARSTVRRKINITVKQLNDVADGLFGRIQSNVTKKPGSEAYGEVVYFLKSYETTDAANASERLRFVTYLIDHCQKFLDLSVEGQDETTLARRRLVTDLHGEARTELGRLQAQQEYTRAAYAAPDPTAPATSGLLNQTDAAGSGLYKVREGAQALAAGRPVPNNGPGGYDEAAHKVMKKYNLSEAEVLAIRTYTAGDYAYINPAMVSYPQQTPAAAGDQKSEAQTRDEANGAWWSSKQSAQAGPAGAQLRVEGATHAGFLLAALTRLPVVKATTWRGMQYPAAMIATDLVAGATITWHTFTSTSLDERKASGFAKAGDPTATVFEITVTNGRDMTTLSVFHKIEQEVLLLPGAKFTVTKVTTMPRTGIRLVKITQVI